ncbi:hypothetical protein C3L33_05131, partial [Rhododendron williamsianum]
MTKVYGTGVYDFRRHRVAEYPAAAEKPPESQTGSNLPSAITLGGRGEGEEGPPFSEELVKEIYETELAVRGGRKTVPLQRVMILEVSQYLENYLKVGIVEIENFRENVAAWICFYDKKDMFKAFLERVFRLKEGRSLTIAEKTNYLLFMINAFQSLGDEIVCDNISRLASPQCWHSLSYGRFQMELCLNPDMLKLWKRITKKAREATKRGEIFDPSTSLEVTFVRNLIQEFLEVLDSNVFPHNQCGSDTVDVNRFEEVDDASVLYCERVLKPLVADVAVVSKCHLSVLYRHEKGKLFAQLVNLLQFYERFEIDDRLGRQMTDDEVLQSHYNRLQAFQLLAYKKIPKLRELALANIGAINRRSDLSKKLSVLSPEELRDLVCCKLKLVSKEDPWSERVDFLVEVMVSFFEKQQSQKESINALPLYPNEQIMWDESVVPSINYTGEGCLALPKLNLQFLTLHDYLLRNFNLFRLESTYEIREDIQEAVPHLLAHISNEGETAFRGWSRMAVPIREFKVTEVKQPNIGEVKPSSVTAEPLSADEAAKATVPQKLGLQYVRGCEIIEMRDEDGTLMNDFTGRIKRDEWKPPKGELRTVTVALDTAQYHMDCTDIAEKGREDVYSTFHVLMRRKPKENNFKAILESIRDLMNESCIVPDWLHDIFLGYGNPSAAQWINMPDLLEAVDFKDTFLDVDHVRESFSDYQVCFTNSDGTENLHPKPPFRIRLPKNLKGNTYALAGNEKSAITSVNDANLVDASSEREQLIVEAYVPPDPGPYPQDQPKQNSVRFTPTQASLSPEMTVLLSVVYRICSVFSQCLFEWKYYADLVDNSVSLKLKMG